MHDPVATRRKLGRMRDQHQRRPMPVAQGKEQVHDRRSVRAIKIARRLVRQQDVGPRDEGTGQRHPLLFTTGHLAGIMARAVHKAHSLQLGLRPVKGVARAGQLQRSGDVFERGHGRDQMKALEDDAHMGAAKAGQRVLVHRGQVGA